MNTLQKIQLTGAVILLLCIFPLPYGFYTIVRVATMVISAYLAYTYFTKNRMILAIIFTIIAIVFQPFIKLALGRDVWLTVDIIVAATLIVLAFRVKLDK